MLLKILPTFIIFFLGLALKEFKVFGKESADTFLKTVFYVAIPASVMVSLSVLPLTRDLVYLPFLPWIINLSVLLVAYLVGRAFRLPKKVFGPFMIGTSIMNTGFVLPFVTAVYGNEGLAKLLLFDAGNAFFTFTVAYYIASECGTDHGDIRLALKKLFLSPPLWAIVVALLLNVTKTPLNSVVHQVLLTLSYLTVPLVLLALGIRFNPRIISLKKEVAAVAIRMGLGLVLGFALVTIFQLEGLTRAVVILCSSAPIAFNTLTFANMEKLDEEFSASIISLSLIVGIFSIPLLMFFL